MMSTHNQALKILVEKLKNRVESNLIEDRSEQSKKKYLNLASSNQMLSNLLQMKKQLNYMLNNFTVNSQCFNLQEVINYSIEGLSVSLHQLTILSFVHDDRLPEVLSGDLDNFKLALITVIEFAVKYCFSGQITLKTTFQSVGVNDRNTIHVGFQLNLTLNKAFLDE